jgi:predicted MPP superfamily phosphohydrolase
VAGDKGERTGYQLLMAPESSGSRTRGAGIGEGLRLAFFRAFFSLLLGWVALSEWAVIAWIATRCGVQIPLAGHLAGAVAVLLLNRRIAPYLRSRHPVLRPLLRVYGACAFTAIFCGVFLGLAGLLWGVVWLGAAPIGVVWAGVVPQAEPVILGQVFARAVDVGLAAIIGLCTLGYTAGRRALAITRLTVPVEGLPPALDGFRIAHLSDLHIGAHLEIAELAGHVARVNALAPDLVCITGDLVDRAESCATAFPVLAGLRAPHGVLVTLGNHDFGAGAESVTAALRAHTPFTVLRDAHTDVVVGEATLPILGVDDLGRDWARGVPEHPALPPLAATVRSGARFVVLTHRPDCFPQAAALGACLVLSGHTHGGQLGLPSLFGRRVRNLAEFITRFDRGLYCRGGAVLYVNRGLGFTGQPIRLFTSREIAVLELRRAI